MDDREKQANYELAEKLLAEQNFPAAVIAGAVATVLAAVAYGMIVAKWEFSYGFMAAGVGIVIGLAMQFVGRGISMRFSVVATVYAIAGCLLGNMFALVTGLARATAASPIEVLQNSSLPALAERSVSHVSYVDLTFWFIAAFAAVFCARRPLSRADRLALGLLELRG